ncbi:hypothetical protein F442_18071 [Phytophthora nicotianae P10297]|uniref:Ubiquitin-like protease family profile domain-containing protein n=1 Tax=Phytophthora nicotianae P10297 TaxID=1317064 RepID=W2YF41_PHYNI|nr:hypothetical protein F442_18071 [Phytophthora nicotianae P10297]
MQESNAVWDSNRKYREANYIASSISEHLSGLGMKDYRTAMSALRNIATLFTSGKYDAIGQHSDTNSKDSSSGEDLRVASGETEYNELRVASGETTSCAVEIEGSELASLRSDAVQVTQAAAEVNYNIADLGSDTAELGSDTAELGSGSTQLGRQNARLDSNCTVLTRQDCENEQNDIPNNKIIELNEAGARSVDLTGVNAEFALKIPPKPRGRPKQMPKAVKAKRNLTIEMAQEDMTMHECNMNLEKVRELLDNHPTLLSSSETLLQFNVFKFLTKPKPPIVYEISKLPATKPLMREDEIVRVFPLDLIRKCGAKVTAYQRKRRGVRELDVAFEIVGLGVFTNTTIKLMKKWHAATVACKKIGNALTWISKMDFSRHGNSGFYVEADPTLPNKLKKMQILTSQIEVLALVGKELISDEVMHKLLTKLFLPGSGVVVFDASTLGVVVDGEVSTSNDVIREALSGVSNDKVLIPVNCHGNHWCSIMINLEGGTVDVYDSSSSSYLVGVRAVAQKMMILLPTNVKKPARVRTFESSLGVQTDSYNCGIYVLLGFEMFCGAEPLGYLDKKALQCLR